MILGIVGSEAAKFTDRGAINAIALIKDLIEIHCADVVSSGACHLGGVDIWAERIAREFNLETKIFPPRVRCWDGYKERNMQIAEASDIVVCISVDMLPDNYKGMRFSRCYHHLDQDGIQPHVKSGGCWTAKYARSLGKQGLLYVVKNEG